MSKVIRRHILTNVFLLVRSCWKPSTFQQLMTFSHYPPMKVVSLSEPSNGLARPKPMTPAYINLINKRFFRSGNGAFREVSSFSYKLFATLGVLAGIFNMGGHLRNGSHLVACKAKDKPKEEDCAEKKCEDSPCLRKRECEEELIIAANAELELALLDTKQKAVQFTEAAMKSYCEAIDAMQEFLEYGYCVVNNDKLEPLIYQEMWGRVYEMSTKRCEKVKEALMTGQTAWGLCCRLRELIKDGRICNYTSANPLLVPLEEAVQCIEKELVKLKAKLDAVHSTNEMVAKYKSDIAKFGEDLREDVRKQNSSCTGCCKTKHAEQEKALMIAEAYKRVIRIHKEWAWSLANSPSNDCNCKREDKGKDFQ